MTRPIERLTMYLKPERRIIRLTAGNPDATISLLTSILLLLTLLPRPLRALQLLWYFPYRSSAFIVGNRNACKEPANS